MIGGIIGLRVGWGIVLDRLLLRRRRRVNWDGRELKLGIKYNWNFQYGAPLLLCWDCHSHVLNGWDADGRWISTEEIPNQHSHSGSNAFLIMAYPFLGGIAFMVLCRVLYSIIWSRQKIASVASVRQQTKFETTGLNLGKGKMKREREMV